MVGKLLKEVALDLGNDRKIRELTGHSRFRVIKARSVLEIFSN